MERTEELSELLERGRFERAMKMSPEEKFFSGGQLFEFACRVTLAGIRDQYPEASDDGVLEILRERMEKSRQYEERRR